MLTYIEITKYSKYEPQVNGVLSRDNLARIRYDNYR